MTWDRATEVWVAWGIEKAQEYARTHAGAAESRASTRMDQRDTDAAQGRQIESERP